LAPLPENASTEDVSAAEIIAQLERDVLDAQDNLLGAKIFQSYYANKAVLSGQ
jgi:hypothetical protein